MDSNIEKGLKAEDQSQFDTAFSAYKSARSSEDPRVRNAGAAGLLRLYERGELPDHVLTLLSILVMFIAVVGGGLLIFNALPKGAGSSVPANAFGISVGVATILGGLVSAALMSATARIVRLIECMELRQACESFSRLSPDLLPPYAKDPDPVLDAEEPYDLKF